LGKPIGGLRVLIFDSAQLRMGVRKKTGHNGGRE